MTIERSLSMIERNLIASLAVLTAAASVASALTPMTAEASNNLDYRKKVIGVAGIMSVSTGMDQQVTRAEFARMLVNASTYRDYLPASSAVSVYADVPKTSEYAASIRIAAEQKWMVGYLGGQFRPDQPITLQEAVRGILGLLGYSNEDFTGDTSGARMSKYYALELNSEVDRKPNEILTRNDCVNLFYNLLKTEDKTGKAYGTVLGCEINSDGEVNPMGLADNNLKGPKLIPKGRQLGDYVPFNVQQATIFVDGEASSYESLKGVLSGSYVVVYYNTTAKTIWAYVADDDGDGVQSGRCAVRGTISNIYYNSTDVMTPTAVYLDGDDDKEFKLGNSEMQFAFSIYGSLRVGDNVTLICEKTTNSDGDATYTVIDYVED